MLRHVMLTFFYVTSYKRRSEKVDAKFSRTTLHVTLSFRPLGNSSLSLMI